MLSTWGFLLAVAEGFEPSVVLPTLAFEASTFGRSDTPPKVSKSSAHAACSNSD